MINQKPNSLELSQGESAFKADLSLSKIISNKTDKKVAIFGGAGIERASEYYSKAEQLAELISNAGISIITGGGPGIMEAGNKGASKGKTNKSLSYGLKVTAIKEEVIAANKYISKNSEFIFETLAVRLLTLISVSDAVVFFPGGFGTLEEMFSLLVRIKVNMMKPIPIYMFSKAYWGGLVSWLDGVVKKEKAINEMNLQMFKVEDDVKKISKEIIDHCSKKD